jgi:hypothetical protein
MRVLSRLQALSRLVQINLLLSEDIRKRSGSDDLAAVKACEQ